MLFVRTGVDSQNQHVCAEAHAYYMLESAYTYKEESTYCLFFPIMIKYVYKNDTMFMSFYQIPNTISSTK